MTQLVIIGAGPAGLCAAVEFARLGGDVVVVDEKPAAGGQLFKQIHKFFGSEEHGAGRRGYEIGEDLLAQCEKLGVRIMLNTFAWGLYSNDRLRVGLYDRRHGSILEADSALVATGAGENVLAFPGWTLPGVMGAGAAQTLVNYQRVLPGRKALVVGAGNVGLIVAYQLLQAGIEVAAIVEAAGEVGGYMVHASKIRRTGVPIYTNHTVLAAEGEDSLESATICKVDDRFNPLPETARTLEVDLLCVSVGLTPAVELCTAIKLEAAYVGELGGVVPVHNEEMRTSHPRIFVAGDVSGVEEASTAMEEGRLAALSAAQALGLREAGALDAKKERIRARLRALRSGPFGDLRRTRKVELTAQSAGWSSQPVG